jgi:hypothetical protein
LKVPLHDIPRFPASIAPMASLSTNVSYNEPMLSNIVPVHHRFIGHFYPHS